MKYSKLKGLATASILMFVTPGCAPFAGGHPLVTTQGAGCSQLLPTEWREGVQSAPLPAGDTIGDWIAFGDAQTGRLDVANERTTATIGIVERCEARDAEAVRRATRRRFLGIF